MGSRRGGSSVSQSGRVCAMGQRHDAVVPPRVGNLRFVLAPRIQVGPRAPCIGPCPSCLTRPVAAEPPASAWASWPPPQPHTIQLKIFGSCDDKGVSHPSPHPRPLSYLKPDPCIVAPLSPLRCGCHHRCRVVITVVAAAIHCSIIVSISNDSALCRGPTHGS
jgi:hypothetical protein